VLWHQRVSACYTADVVCRGGRRVRNVSAAFLNARLVIIVVVISCPRVISLPSLRQFSCLHILAAVCPLSMIDFSITTCHIVPSGRYYKTSNFARTPCEPGYRCVAGVRSACSSDYEYQNGTQSNSCVTVTTGYYTTPIGGSAHTGQTQCEPGYYCAGGVRWVCSGHNEYVIHTHSANDHRARGCEDVALCAWLCRVVQRPHRSIQSGCALVSTLFIARVGLVFTILFF